MFRLPQVPFEIASGVPHESFAERLAKPGDTFEHCEEKFLFLLVEVDAAVLDAVAHDLHFSTRCSSHHNKRRKQIHSTPLKPGVTRKAPTAPGTRRLLSRGTPCALASFDRSRAGGSTQVCRLREETSTPSCRAGTPGGIGCISFPFPPKVDFELVVRVQVDLINQFADLKRGHIAEQCVPRLMLLFRNHRDVPVLVAAAYRGRPAMMSGTLFVGHNTPLCDII